eukprot:g4586.t1
MKHIAVNEDQSEAKCDGEMHKWRGYVIRLKFYDNFELLDGCRSISVRDKDMAKGNISESEIINDTLKENRKDSELDENGVKLGCGDWLVLDSESSENVNADADAFENFKQEPSEGFVMLS